MIVIFHACLCPTTVHFHLILQIYERKNEEQMARLNLKMEEEEEQEADAAYQDFLQQETQHMRKRGFTPRVQTSLFQYHPNQFYTITRGVLIK